MSDREWKLGVDLITSDNLLDPVTFDDVILAVRCNCRKIDKNAVRKTLREILEQRLQDTWYLLEMNEDAIIEAAKR